MICKNCRNRKFVPQPNWPRALRVVGKKIYNPQSVLRPYVCLECAHVFYTLEKYDSPIKLRNQDNLIEDFQPYRIAEPKYAFEMLEARRSWMDCPNCQNVDFIPNENCYRPHDNLGGFENYLTVNFRRYKCRDCGFAFKTRETFDHSIRLITNQMDLLDAVESHKVA